MNRDSAAARPAQGSSSLRRTMGLAHATAMVVGIILGASIFVQPAEITRLVPSTWELLLVWLGAGALTLCGALVCAELAAVFPHTGGVYVFLKETYGAPVGFLWGWAMFWSMHTGIIAAIAVILARYVAYFVPLGESGVRAVAMASILLLSAINYAGVKPGSAVQLLLTIAKLGAIVAIAVLLFFFGGAAHAQIPPQAAGHISLISYGLAIAAGLFAYGGWHMVTYAAGETREPQRTIPRALLAGTLIVTGCYLLLNAAYQYVLPLAEVARSTRVAADSMQHVLGREAGAIIAIVVILSALGADNGIILAGPRVYFAMAQDGLAFRWFGTVHSRFRTPYLAIAAQAVWACVLVATNSYRELFTRVVYTEWLFFALLAVGLFRLRRCGQYTPRYLGRAYPLVPALFAIVAAGIAVNQGLANVRGSFMGMGLLLLGVPAYFLWMRQKERHADH